MTDQHWASDVPVSLPAPAPTAPLVDMGGFGFSTYGMVHMITVADVDEFIPTFAPQALRDE